MTTCYSYRTRRGVFRAVLKRGRWRAMFEDEDLGPYRTARDAAYAIANGETSWPSCGNPMLLRIPEELDDWSPECP